MALKLFYKNKSDIPKGLEEHYEESDEGYTLATDDKGFKEKLAEFRTNNRDLFSKNEGLQKQLKTLEKMDPTKYEEGLVALAKMEEMRDKKMIEEGKLDEVLHERTERMRAEYDGKLENLQAQLEKANKTADTATGRLSSTLIDSAVHQAVSSAGSLRSGALMDVISRAKQVWQLDDDQNLIPMKDNKVLYGKDGDTQLTMEEWTAGLIEVAPYLFESSKGTGSKGGEKFRSIDGKTVQAGDAEAFGANLESIAKGTVQVVQTG